MSSCPNSDPQFDKILSRYVDVKSPDYPLVRKRLFYMVCVVVRLVLYTLVLVYRNEKWMPYVVGGGSLLSVINLSRNLTGGRQWWSKRFQFIMSIAILIACMLIILGVNRVNTLVVPILLYVSLLGGLAQSFTIKFC